MNRKTEIYKREQSWIFSRQKWNANFSKTMPCYNKLQQQYGRFSLAGLQFISRTISAKTSLTFILIRADASMKGQFHACARASPSIVATSLWCSRSTLFPTNSKGTRSVPLTRVIYRFHKTWRMMRMKTWWLNYKTHLFPHVFDILKCLVVCHWVNNHKPLAISDVKVPHWSKLLGPSRIQNFKDWGRAINFNLFAVEVFNSRVILFHKAARHKLYC